MTERPETSMSVRTTAGGPLAVKKTRTANANKKPAPKAPRAKRSTAVAPKNSSRSSSPAQAAKASQRAVDEVGDGLDNISSGIKKITLATKQQKEARKKGDTTAPTDTSLPPSTPEPIQQQTSPPQETMSQAILPREIPLPDSREDTLKATISSLATPDVFIPYQPEGPDPSAIPPQEPLKWPPPSTSTTPSPGRRQPDFAFITPSPSRQAAPSMFTPSPTTQVDLTGMASPSLMKRANLPIFTATSQIPFAPRTPSGQTPAPMSPSPTAKVETLQDEAIWEVPEAPE